MSRRPLYLISFLTCLLGAFASPASASVRLSLSLGEGVEVSPDQRPQATNLMFTPGWSPIDLLRLELGILTGLENARNGSTAGLNLEFRPMLVISPPLIPIYLRAIFAIIDPTDDGGRRTVAYGGALGLGGSLAGLGLFVEAGVLPRILRNEVRWVVEGRAGVSIEL